MANPRSHRASHHLLTQLNAAELTYPGTNVTLVDPLARGPDHSNGGPHIFPEVRRSESTKRPVFRVEGREPQVV